MNLFNHILFKFCTDRCTVFAISEREIMGQETILATKSTIGIRNEYNNV